MAEDQNGAGDTLNKPEKQLIKMIRELGFGELRVIVQNGRPVRAEEIKKSVVLEQNEK